MAKKSTALARVAPISSPLAPARKLTQDDLTDRSIPAIQRAQFLRYPMAMQVVQTLQAIQGRPLGAKVLILPLPPDDHSAGIIIPESARADQAVGIVVAVGPGYLDAGRYIPLHIQPGNFVHFSHHIAEHIKIGDCELFQIHEQEISFVVGAPPKVEDAEDKA